MEDAEDIFGDGEDSQDVAGGGPSKRKRDDADEDVEDLVGDDGGAVGGADGAAGGTELDEADVEGDEEEDEDEDDEDDDEDDDDEDDDEDGDGGSGGQSKRSKLDEEAASSKRMSKSEKKALKKRRRLEEKLAKKGVTPGEIEKKKKKKKADVKKLIDDQAEEDDDEGSGDSDDEDGEDAEDLDNYQIDGFVVGDDDDDDSSDEEDVFARRGGPKVKKTERKRLRKTGKAMLDEDDLALVQENRAEFEEEGEDEGEPERDQDDREGEGEDEDDEGGYIDPDAESGRARQNRAYFEDEEDEMDDFIVDDAGDGDEPREARNRKKRPVAPIRRMYTGPTADEIQESIDIFGIDNLDDLLADGDDEEGEGFTEVDRVVKDREEGKNRKLNKLERHAMVVNFATESDNDIRYADVPERIIQTIQTSPNLYPSNKFAEDSPKVKDDGGRIDYETSTFKARWLTTDEDRDLEARWMAKKLAQRLNEEYNREEKFDELDVRRESSRVVDLIRAGICDVLKFMHVECLEIQFIWTYRRDYLPEIITRKHLWLIFTWDEKWRARQLLANDIKELYDTMGACMESARDSFYEEKRERISRIHGLRRQRIDLQSRQADADAEVERLKAESNEKQRYDDEITDEDHLYNAERTQEELKEELKNCEESLAKEESDQSDADKRNLKVSCYDPAKAEEVINQIPRERFLAMVERAAFDSVDDDHLKDIYNFLLLFTRQARRDDVKDIKAGEMDLGDNSDDEMRDGKKQDLRGKVAKDLETAKEKAGRKRLQKLTGEDKFGYFRYRQSFRLVELAKKFARVANEFGDALTHNWALNAPDGYDPMVLNEEVLALVGDEPGQFPSGPDVYKAVSVIIATEYSHEPTLLAMLRAKFLGEASISTRPTEKGLQQISPFSELFGLHFLDHKPVNEFLKMRDRTLYVRLLQAESDGLITISINYPKATLEGDAIMMQKFAYETAIYQKMVTQGDYADETRMFALQSLLRDHVLPELERELRRELLRSSKEAVLEEVADNFENMLSMGPVRLKPYVPENREAEREYFRETIKSCPARPAHPSVAVLFVLEQQPFIMVFLDKDGMVRAHELIPAKAVGKKDRPVKKFLKDHLPDVVVVNSSGGYLAKTIAADLERRWLDELRHDIETEKKRRRERREEEGRGHLQYADDDDDTPEYRPHVTLLDDEIAKIFLHSQRAKDMFPDYEPVMSAAICLGRFSQEPLSEYCNMWTSTNSRGQFGYEALFLKIHPLQGCLKSAPKAVLNTLENVLRNAVCETGVEINLAMNQEHHSARLAFVAGLGLRKAFFLKRNLGKSIVSRQQLISIGQLGQTVWTNAVGFVRISEEYVDAHHEVNPFDNTRIHPECYLGQDWAHKICADAIEREHNREDYFELVKDLIEQVKMDVAKRLKSHRWIDLWLDQGRPVCGKTKYTELVKTISDGKEVTIDRKLEAEVQDVLYQLDLDTYIQGLEMEHGKRGLQIVQIKEELRFPWLDLRKPLSPPTPSALFTLVTGETDSSMHVGLKVGVTVTDVKVLNNDDGGQPRQKAMVQTDSGLRGTIAAADVVEDRSSLDTLDLRALLPPKSRQEAVVIAVDKRFFSVMLSMQPRYLRVGEDWWMRNRREDRFARRWFEDVHGSKVERMFPTFFNEDLALSEFAKIEAAQMNRSSRSLGMGASGRPDGGAGGQSQKVLMRAIHHPLFVNCNCKQAEERLKAAVHHSGVGQVIFRPSSKLDNITASWLMHQDMSVLHFPFEERGKSKGSLALGKELVYRQKIGKTSYFSEVYSDLDEIYVRFIEPMNIYVKKMIDFGYFKSDLRDEGSIEDWLLQEREINVKKAEEANSRNPSFQRPVKPPFCFTFNTGSVGGFHTFQIKWMKNANKPPGQRTISHDVICTPEGFRFCGMYYLSPKEVFQAFIKRAEEASMIKQPTSLGLGLAQQQQAQRKSRFSSAVQQQQQQQPPMPPMPMGGPMGAYPGQPGPYYGAGMGPMGGYPPAPPVGSSGAYGYSDYGYGGGGERRY